MQQIQDITALAFSEKGSCYEFMNHDIKIFFGDLNFRVNMSYDSIINSIDNMTEENKDEEMHILLNNDQFNQ